MKFTPFEPNTHHEQNIFLNQNKIYKSINIFQCCTRQPDQVRRQSRDYSYVKSRPEKVSIKELMKKSTLTQKKPENSQYSNTDQNKWDQSAINNCQSNFGPAQSQLSRSGVSINRAVSAKSFKINFSYNSEEEQIPPNAINNYHTTNYIVERYIVQPRQMKIFVNQQNLQANHLKTSPMSYPQPQYTQNIKNYCFQKPSIEPKQQTPAKIHSNKIPQQNRKQTTKEEEPLYGNFSFGLHQKQAFMSKYLNVKNSESKRQSVNSKQSKIEKASLQPENRFSQQINQIESSPIVIKRSAFQAGSLIQRVKRAETMKDCYQDSDHQSEVIEDYKSLMNKIHSCNKLDDDEDEQED